MVDEAKSLGINAGIYSSYYNWQRLIIYLINNFKIYKKYSIVGLDWTCKNFLFIFIFFFIKTFYRSLIIRITHLVW